MSIKTLQYSDYNKIEDNSKYTTEYFLLYTFIFNVNVFFIFFVQLQSQFKQKKYTQNIKITDRAALMNYMNTITKNFKNK